MKLLSILTAICMCATVAFADENFDRNAKGLSIGKVKGRTVVGVTRDTSKVWSLYISNDKTAKYHFSTGKRKTVKWRQPSRNTICIRGLNDAKPNDEVCKLAKPLGRGMDWVTVKIFERDGKVTYQLVDPDAHRGSSQIVYSFPGEAEVAKNSYLYDLREWKGHTVVGRTIKDKEAWFVNFGLDGEMDFVFGSGKRFKGTYTLSKSEVCMKFYDKPAFNGCRKPAVKKNKIAWISTQTGGHTSEIVYMKRTEKPGPKLYKKLSRNKHHMVAIDDQRKTFAAVSRVGAGSVKVYDAKSGLYLASIPQYAQDISFNDAGSKLIGGFRDEVWQADVATGQLDWVTSRDPNATFSELSYSADQNYVLIGDNAGYLNKYDAKTGKFVSKSKVADDYISDIDVNKFGRVLVGTRTGQLFTGQDQNLDDFTMIETLPNPVTIVQFTKSGAGFRVLTKAGNVLKGMTGATKDGMKIVNRQSTGLQASYNLSLSHDQSEMIIAGENGMKLLNSDTLEETLDMPKDATSPYSSVVYLTSQSGFVGTLKDGGLDIWTRDSNALSKLRRFISGNQSNARIRKRKIKEVTDRIEREYKELQAKLGALYNEGKCEDYNTQVSGLRKRDRKENCEAEAIRREQMEIYNTALKQLRCEDAQSFRLEVGIGSEFRERKCIDQRQLKEDRRAFDLAVNTNDCDIVSKFEAKFNKVGAADECHFQSALSADNARQLFFAAVRMDTAKQNDRAKRLYIEVMNRFPDDDLAIDAAKRLTELGDQEAQAKKDAENAAALSAAQKALEQAKRDKDQALREARQREEKAKREAAEARARAAEARAREAEARAKANQQPRRNTACDHVTVGRRFSIKGGGFFGIGDATYTVIGISRAGGVVTARMLGTDIQKQFRCSSVR